MTTVIEALEAQDNSPKVKIEKLMAYSNTIQNWFRVIDREVDSARSTHFVQGVRLEQYPPSDFVIEIKTTKSAISDKRFEILMDTPPQGYAIMGKQKSRKDATILYQYVRMEEMALSEADCVKLARSSQLESFLNQLRENRARAKSQLEGYTSDEISVRDATQILSLSKQENYYNALIRTLTQAHEVYFGEDDREVNYDNVALSIIGRLVSVEQVEGICYSMSTQRLVSEYSTQIWYWREGDKFPSDVMWKLRNMT